MGPFKDTNVLVYSLDGYNHEYMNIGIIGQEEVCHCLLKINLICIDIHSKKYTKKDLDPEFWLNIVEMSILNIFYL